MMPATPKGQATVSLIRGGAAVVIDRKIYVAGGRPPRGADFAMYDPEQDRWTTLPDCPLSATIWQVLRLTEKCT